MPIAIDASSPALATGNSVTAVTTATFNPPANSLLIAVSMWDTTGAVTPSVAMTNNGAALDVAWTLAKKMDQSTGATDGLVHIYTGQITSSRTGMTITSTPSGTGFAFDERGGLKVYVVTGHTASPLGATGSGESATNNITPTVYTSTVNNSWCFGGATNKTDLGAPTSTDVETAFSLAFAVEGEAVTKAAATATSGTGETLNFDAAGASAAAWNWAAIEIKPAAAGGDQPYQPWMQRGPILAQ